MDILKERILREASILSSDVLKLDGLLNHQVDPELTMLMGQEFARRLRRITLQKSLLWSPQAFRSPLRQR